MTDKMMMMIEWSRVETLALRCVLKVQRTHAILTPVLWSRNARNSCKLVFRTYT